MKALSIKPDLASAHNNLGVIYSDRNEVEKAHYHYHRATQIIPNYSEAYHNQGILYLENRKAEEARAQFQSALELRPERHPTRLSLAKAEMALRNFETVMRMRLDHVDLVIRS
ncbi:tetratricopeptide repeat protein [Opitutia bacterium ISCC 51]|nr:tetratricopeptide repeat protein [Opitutae bacterium ISCC 51]QXD30439.1 tetratricopeptide repeat protein [Opitutae bacterium ISCC 52]